MFNIFKNNKSTIAQQPKAEAQTPVVQVEVKQEVTQAEAPVVEAKSKQEIALEAVLAKLAQKEREAEDLRLQKEALENKNAQEQAALDAEVLQKKQFNELLLNSAKAVQAAHEEVQVRQAELDTTLTDYIEADAKRKARLKDEQEKEDRRIAAMMEWLNNI